MDPKPITTTAKAGNPAILILNKLTTAELHDQIENFVASERLKGNKITKAEACVVLIKKGLQLKS